MPGKQDVTCPQFPQIKFPIFIINSWDRVIMNDDDLKYWIALKSIPGIGNVLFPALLERFGSAPAVFDASVSDLKAVEGISKKTASAIADFKAWEKVKEELELIKKISS